MLWRPWRPRLGHVNPPRVSHVIRRTAIGAISGLLVLAALFAGNASGDPALARDITWDDPMDNQAVFTTGAGAWPTSTPTSTGLDVPLKAPVAQAPSPTLDPLPSRANMGDVRASEQPERVVASARGGPRPTPDLSTPEKFIAAVAEAAQEAQQETRVPSSVTIAQAILESDWGRSLLAKKAQNYFGIKATRGPGPAGVINMSTWEVLGGQNVTVSDGFKAYHNMWESVMDHGHFLADNPRYAAAFKVLGDAQEFARRIRAAGYATDPAYSSKLINLMNKYNLYQYDLKVP